MKETCTKVKMDDRMMFNAKVAHSQYIAKNELNKASTEMSLKIKLEIMYN